MVETLVALAILILLGTLLVPTWQNFRNRTQGAQCASQLRQIAAAGLAWANDNQGRLPDTTRWFSRSKGDAYSLFGYLGFPDTGQQVLRDTVFTCPVFQKTYPTQVSPHRTYSINRYATGSNVGDAAAWAQVLNADPPQVLARVKYPSQMAFFMDGRPNSVIPASSHSYRTYAATDSIGSSATPHLHESGLNVAFLDGHVERISSAWIEQEQLGVSPRRVHPFWGAEK